MKQLFAALLLALTFNSQAMAQQRTVKLRVIETSDVHGSFFPYDFINRKPKAGTLARVSSYVNNLRKDYKDNLILLENGDILQGQPTCYYYNYVNTEARNVAADVVNYMKEPTLKSKACLKCLYFTKIISALCCYLEYFSYLYTIN